MKASRAAVRQAEAVEQTAQAALTLQQQLDGLLERIGRIEAKIDTLMAQRAEPPKAAPHKEPK